MHGRYVPRYFTGLWIHFTVSDRFAPEERRNHQDDAVRKITLLSNLNGYAPPIAVEFGRKTLYSSERPSFIELEEHVRAVRNPNQQQTTEEAWKNQAHPIVVVKRRRHKPHSGGAHVPGKLPTRFYDGDDGFFSGDVADFYLQP
ncbi:motility protein A [Salmonella enterica subsp. enterica]|nr:motility protein A [Salmonella enterica subsp. enterica] [Salmonella enterica subsp. enterica serovar Menston]